MSKTKQEPLTPTVARDLFVNASLARPDRQMVVLAQRLADKVGASHIQLLQRRCGRIESLDLQIRDARPLAASPTQKDLYAAAGPTPKLIDASTLVVSVPAATDPDPLTHKLQHAALIIKFDPNSPFLEGRGRSWNGLRLLGNLADQLIQSERAYLVSNRLKQLHRRTAQLRQAGDVGYVAVHAIRDVLGFDGHCALLMYDRANCDFEVLAHVSGRRREPDHDLFTVSADRIVAEGVMGDPSVSRCWVASERNSKLSVYDLVDVDVRSQPSVEMPDEAAHKALSVLIPQFREAGLVRGSSILSFPLHQGGEALGLLVISAISPNAFALQEAALAWGFALGCISPLSQASRLVRDFQLSESVLERTAALQHDLPLEENRPLTATLSLLCERLRFALTADSVLLLPYAHKRGRFVKDGAAGAGPEPEIDASEPTPDGVVAAILTTKVPREWRSEDKKPLDVTDYVDGHQFGRIYGIPLTMEDGSPLGVALVNWNVETLQRTKGWRELSRLDRQRGHEFRRVVESYLGRHSEWFADLKSQRLLSGAYTSLLRAIGEHDAYPAELDFESTRQAILSQLLDASLDLVGGTAGIFAVPSGDSSGLTVAAHRGHDPEIAERHIAYEEGVTGYVAETKAPCVIPDSDDPATWPADVTPVALIPEIKSECAFPVTDGSVQELLLGVFDIENQVVSYAYRDRDLELAKRIAQVASITIGLTRQLAQVQSIARLGQLIDEANLESEEKVFCVALQEAASVTGAFAASARMADRRGDMLLPVYHYGVPGTLSQDPIKVGEGVNGAAFRAGEPVIIGDSKDPETFPELRGFSYLPARDETRSECAIPIQWHGRKIGACNFEHRQPYALTPYRLYLLTVGAQVCHALQQRRQRDRALLEQGIDLVKVLSAFYMIVNHSISHSFTEIRNKLSDIDVGGIGKAHQRLTETRALADVGAKNAAALLAGASGSVEEMVVVNVRQLLDTVVNKVKRIHERELKIDIDDDTYAVIARPGMLGWILEEIIDNSFTYGGRRTAVWLSVQAVASGSLIEFTIDDNGKGLPAKRRETLYDLEQLSQGGRWDGRRDHHGLALLAAKVYLETMNGGISSTQSPQGGLRTVVRLPRRRS